MALIESLGYKKESPRHNNIGDGSNLLMNDLSGSYGQNININHNSKRNRGFDYESKHNWNRSQQTNTFLMNNHNNFPYTNQQSQHTLFRSPKHHQTELKQDSSSMNINKNKSNINKYSSIPRKSMLSSGIGAISPIPQKQKQKYNTNSSSLLNTNINRLDLTGNANRLQSSNNYSMPISPIKPNKNANKNTNNNTNTNRNNNNNNNTLFSDNSLHLNLSNIPHMNNMNHQSMNNICNDKQILVIGFPPNESSFIHRKFRSYGNIIDAKLNNNTLFLQYQNKLHARRGLAENAKWITNGNLKYMISVIYYDIALRNNQQIENVRSVNLNEISQINQMKQNINQTRHFAQDYQHLEKPPDLQSGPTHILWKIFNFITSGW